MGNTRSYFGNNSQMTNVIPPLVGAGADVNAKNKLRGPAYPERVVELLQDLGWPNHVTDAVWSFCVEQRESAEPGGEESSQLASVNSVPALIKRSPALDSDQPHRGTGSGMQNTSESISRSSSVDSDIFYPTSLTRSVMYNVYVSKP